MQRLADPETPEEELLPYFVQVPSRSIDPGFQPNPALVTDLGGGLEGGLAVSLLNGWRRRQRHRAYRDRIAGGWSGPRIISEGDSWFQYPTRLQDVIDHLMGDHAILSLGGAGDTLDDMREQDEIIVNADARRRAGDSRFGGRERSFPEREHREPRRAGVQRRAAG